MFDPYCQAGNNSNHQLGGVTGDASYFLMNEEKRVSHELPTNALTPVLSKARHLTKASIDKTEWERQKKSGERIWLFNPQKNLVKNSNIRRYLRLKLDKGGCNREAYKVSNRDPWYQTPLPTKVDAFLSSMSQQGPWLCINEMKTLNATNTLYVVTFSDREKSVWYMWALTLFTSSVQRQIRRSIYRWFN
jgi:adenine-specific DNA-methyltransferase